MACFRRHCQFAIRLTKMCQIEASLAAISVQKEGRLDWWWFGHDFPMIVRKSKTNRWGLTGPSFWPLIAANNILFPDPFPVGYLGD